MFFIIPAKAGHEVRLSKPIGATVALSKRTMQFWTPAYTEVTCLEIFYEVIKA